MRNLHILRLVGLKSYSNTIASAWLFIISSNQITNRIKHWIVLLLVTLLPNYLILNSEKIIYSIGHSTYSIDQFLNLLQLYKIKAIADVRRFPTSKKYPHFERRKLQSELSKNNIAYLWLGELLGGFRNEGYQLYMKSDSFLQGIQELVSLAEKQTTTLLCAEKLFFRCHRRFISDYLLQLDWQVFHIFDDITTHLHIPTDSLPLDFCF